MRRFVIFAVYEYLLVDFRRQCCQGFLGGLIGLVWSKLSQVVFEHCKVGGCTNRIAKPFFVPVFFLAFLSFGELEGFGSRSKIIPGLSVIGLYGEGLVVTRAFSKNTES